MLNYFEMAEDELEQVSLTINLVPRAREIVNRLRKDTGIPQTEAMVRLLTWFAGLDRNLRRAILDNDPATREQDIRAAFTSMATEEIFRRASEMDLASLAELMRHVAARFDAFIAEAKRPPRQGILRESGRSAPPRGK